jgi:hypothetical protein
VSGDGGPPVEVAALPALAAFFPCSSAALVWRSATRERQGRRVVERWRFPFPDPEEAASLNARAHRRKRENR